MVDWGCNTRIRLLSLKVRKISLVQYNANKRYYISISTGNCSKRKTGVEKLENDLADKLLLEDVLLYINRNHLFDSFKGPLIFISFIIVIYQRLYTKWFAIVCRLRYKGALSVCSQSKIIRWNGYNRWRKRDKLSCYAFITTSLLWTSIVSAIVLEQYLLISKDRSLKREDYIRSLYDSGRRYKVIAGSQMGHSSVGNGLCGNRLVVHLIPRRSPLCWKGGRV